MGRPRTEDELVERARAGRRRRVRGARPPPQEVAFRTAYVITRSAADAEEAAQDAFVKALRGARAVPPRAPLRPGCCASSPTRRATADARRARGRSRARRAGLGAPPGEAAPSPEGALLAGRGAAASCWPRSAGLPERDRLVISYRYLLDLSEAETAAAMGCRPGTVEVTAQPGPRTHARRIGGETMTELEQPPGRPRRRRLPAHAWDRRGRARAPGRGAGSRRSRGGRGSSRPPGPGARRGPRRAARRGGGGRARRDACSTLSASAV